ncbi:cell division protein FtsZ [Pelistega sp. NLN82]|uniref:Cell division protein FtsZ n=1 Tax=Pelistega ratti TaxID=2652177 RepID=A0A6L9Y5X5_9BURK|nr:cell division protein FtsZ [Pelistega ratti]NEN75666.1 cell division protein FtsZ [Pelistega ratti]
MAVGFNIIDEDDVSSQKTSELGFDIIDDTLPSKTLIKVIGVGGAGGNAINHMIESGARGVEFVCANTDSQALKQSKAETKIALGTSGLGAGARPEQGRAAAEQARESIRHALQGAQMVFITAGMGGGTGTGAAPVVAEIAKELGILTVGIVTKPFAFEGAKRMETAEEGIKALTEHVHSLVVVLNEKLYEIMGDDATLEECFKEADNVLNNACAGIAEIINIQGNVNVDFEDVKTIMGEYGQAMMGTATASGPNRAETAAREAIACPLLEGVNLNGARGILINVTANRSNLKMSEVRKINDIINSYADRNAMIISGTAYDESMGDSVRVTVVATGLGRALQLVEDEVSEQQATQAVATGTDGVTLFTPSTEQMASIDIRGGRAFGRGRPFAADRNERDVPAYLRKQAN